jgi:hypothetical protein
MRFMQFHDMMHHDNATCQSTIGGWIGVPLMVKRYAQGLRVKSQMASQGRRETLPRTKIRILLMFSTKNISMGLTNQVTRRGFLIVLTSCTTCL